MTRTLLKLALGTSLALLAGPTDVFAGRGGGRGGGGGGAGRRDSAAVALAAVTAAEPPRSANPARR